MLYRVRYCPAGTSQQAELSVEANSPTEALVKFRHLREDKMSLRGRSDEVRGVVCEAPPDEELFT